MFGLTIIAVAALEVSGIHAVGTDIAGIRGDDGSIVGARQRETKAGNGIGIIGGGAAGLTTAYLLEKKGYDVTVLEKTDSVGGVARTEFVDGKAYDLSIMFIPGGSLACDDTSSDDTACIEPTLKEMIGVSKEALEPADNFFTFDTISKTLQTVPEILQEYAPIDIVTQLLKGLGLSLKLLECLATGNFELYDECADSDMLLSNWGDKYEVPAYAKLITYTSDGLGTGPNAFVANYVDTIGSFASVDVAEVLRNLGVTPDSPLGPFPANIISLLSKPRWFSFKRGFQTFWKSLVQKAKIDVKMNTEVLSLEKTLIGDESKWKVSTSKKDYEFDRVIVATPPLAAISFLPEGVQATLMANGVFEGPANVGILVTGDDSSLTFSGNREAYSFWPTGFGQGTQDLINPLVGNQYSKPGFWVKRHPGRSVFMVGTYELDEKPDAEVLESIKEYATDVLGIHLNEVLYIDRYYFPDGHRHWYGPYGIWAPLQGQANLWFNGECIAGSGIPEIAAFSKFLVDQNF